MDAVIWILGLGVGVFLLDRALLWVESRGWIYYRRSKPGRGASTYHLLEWNAVLDPTMRQVQEERTREEKEEQESGAPPGGSDTDGEGTDRPGLSRRGQGGDGRENGETLR
jgi:hypothetical protein